VLTLLPLAVLLGLMLLIGLQVPGPLAKLITDATETVLGTAPAAAALEGK
jgi:hypothetical protein